ncbi:helix-turn-helix domain-containing protein [Streptomyces sp. NPDC004673]
MSGEAREWVWEHSSSRGTTRCVMLSIADRVADDQCISWASLSDLAKRTNASISTVREALDRMVAADELEVLHDLVGPKRSTVYRMPLAARSLRERHDDAEGAPGDPEAPLTLQISALGRYGIRLREVPESAAKVRKPAVPETGRSRRKPIQSRAGFRHSGVPETGTQNRSEPDLNRRYSSGAAVITATQWQVDPATHAWAHQKGHLDRLGVEGLRAADAKWRAHRSGLGPRPADAWAADWRAWIVREHTVPSPPSHPAPGGPAPAAGMTRADMHTAALLAACGEPIGAE